MVIIIITGDINEQQHLKELMPMGGGRLENGGNAFVDPDHSGAIGEE